MAGETITVSLTCVGCQVTFDLVLDRASYEAWRQGTPVQQAFPDMLIDTRELLISSRGGRPQCGQCFDKLWASG
jgi:hypothetical protein